MNKAHELLVKLVDSIGIIGLDMGGNHKYILGHRSHSIITEIKKYLWEETNKDKSQDIK